MKKSRYTEELTIGASSSHELAFKLQVWLEGNTREKWLKVQLQHRNGVRNGICPFASIITLVQIARIHYVFKETKVIAFERQKKFLLP